ncbi:RING-type E3 ubiquitin transferase [Salvia divinorum]|uniref:RING-type E3 ubiquitin transferase n=1 Tax=Salvia divinorum TaxID=28513 RepID=A0ABD1GJY9_SALDI
MEGQTNPNDSFRGTFDLQQGPPNSYVVASLGNGLGPAESRSSQQMLAQHDGSIGHTSALYNRALPNRGWDPDGPPEPSTAINPGYVGNKVTDISRPLTFRPSHMHLRENSNCPSGLGGGRPHILYKLGHVGTEETLVRYASSCNLGTSLFSSSPSIENNEALALSLGTWGSSCKRKPFEGSSRHFHPGGSSNSKQPMESVAQHLVPGHGTASRNLNTSISSSNTDQLEQLNLGSELGTGRVRSRRFTSSSVQGIAQNPVRNFDSRLRPRLGEPISSDASRGPSVGHSTLYASQSQTQSEHISNINALELMTPLMLPLNLNNSLNEPFVNVNEAGHTHFAHGMNPSVLDMVIHLVLCCSLEKEVTERMKKQILEARLQIFQSTSRNYSGRQFSSATWLPHGNQTSQNPQRSIESAHRIPFPSIESVSGNQRSLVAPLHQASASSGERARLSHARHQSDRGQSSFLRDTRGGNTNGRNVSAAVEGRHRLIRQVLHLSSMRRGVSLRDEDYMLIDPSLNGFSELHDQNIDMRLDDDNMSYEELLALQEQIGNVSTGLSEKKIQDSFKKRKHGAVKASQVMEPCCICQEDYVAGDDIGILDCRHEFHTSCIKQWLILKNICPICKNTALGT